MARHTELHNVLRSSFEGLGRKVGEGKSTPEEQETYIKLFMLLKEEVGSASSKGAEVMRRLEALENFASMVNTERGVAGLSVEGGTPDLAAMMRGYEPQL